MEKNSRISKIFKSGVLALCALATTGASFANNDVNTVSITGHLGNVYVAPGCYAGDYMVRLTNRSVHPQSCTVSCRHIVSTETFSVFLRPYEVSDIFGSHGSGHCKMSCTDQVFGDMFSARFDIRC